MKPVTVLIESADKNWRELIEPRLNDVVELCEKLQHPHSILVDLEKGTYTLTVHVVKK